MAITVERQAAGINGGSHFERRTQRVQFGLVVAAGAIQQNGFFFPPAVGRQQDHADTYLPRIGQGGAIEPRLPVVFGVYAWLKTDLRQRSGRAQRVFPNLSPLPARRPIS